MAKKIPLANSDEFLLVSDPDYEAMIQHVWRLHPAGYAATSIHGRSKLAHRLICPVPEGYVVDHIDHDRLNCTRENLRPVKPAQNNWNARKRSGTTSRFKGVSWDRKLRKWETWITHYGKVLALGMYDDEEFAARVYDAAASDLFEGMGLLNFPGEPIDEAAWQRYKAARNRSYSSRFTGVSAMPRGRWVAYVCGGRKQLYLGTFKSEEEAARARDGYVREHGLTRHKLNFPEPGERDTGARE